MSVAPSKNISTLVPTEGSKFRPSRDQSDVRQAWKQQLKHRDSIRDLHQATETLARSVEKIRRRILGGTQPAKPFKYWRIVWSADNTYNQQDMVIIQDGASAGTYISSIDNNANDPASGIGWTQIASGQYSGQWV